MGRKLARFKVLFLHLPSGTEKSRIYVIIQDLFVVKKCLFDVCYELIGTEFDKLHYKMLFEEWKRRIKENSCERNNRKMIR